MFVNRGSGVNPCPQLELKVISIYLKSVILDHSKAIVDAYQKIIKNTTYSCKKKTFFRMGVGIIRLFFTHSLTNHTLFCHLQNCKLLKHNI